MSDDQERRPDPRPDDTRPHQPFDDDSTRVGGIHPDGDPRSGDVPADRTRQMPPIAGDDATVVTPHGQQPDGTAVMPVAEDWAAQEAAWAGRATVRPPRAADYGTTAADWDALPPPEEEPRGRWWMPILIGIIALLLLALLGWGIYLILQNSDDAETPAPQPSVSAPATTEPTTTPPTTEPTTTRPTTTPPTTQPTETAVTVPALVGLSQQDAQQALDRRGLTYRLIFRSSDDAPAGTVIDSDPAEGQEVPPDTQVTLVIATAAATTDPSVPPPAD